jgi:hypothetical protein
VGEATCETRIGRQHRRALAKAIREDGRRDNKSWKCTSEAPVAPDKWWIRFPSAATSVEPVAVSFQPGRRAIQNQTSVALPLQERCYRRTGKASAYHNHIVGRLGLRLVDHDSVSSSCNDFTS